ncbi:MAG: serine/threonine protein kinase [Gemmataceae bacterium]
MTEEAVFSDALEVADGERDAFLTSACGNDVELRRRVDSLLNAHDRAGAFLEPLVCPPPEIQPYSTDNGAFGETEVRPIAIPGERIGNYQLLDTLGEGGMGVVYRAAQLEPIRRTVALKVIRLGMASKDVLARFDGERQAVARMDHPSIAKVHDAGTTATGQQYFVMELVQGLPLTTYCDSHTLSIDQRLSLFIEICHAVQHAHQKGVIHRDLKPSNLLVTEVDGKPIPKVIDFGVAKAIHDPLTDHTNLTEIGMVIGTRDYMSPEMAGLAAQDIDTRSDIYALGAVLYELLVGDTPFGRDRFKKLSILDALRVIREQEPEPPSRRLSPNSQLSELAAK